MLSTARSGLVVAKVAEIFARAYQLHQAGQPRAAEDLYRQVLAANPNYADAWHLLGVVAYQTGEYESAVQHISRAIALHPSQSVFHSNLGNALQALGKITDAIESYRQAVQLDPQIPDYYNNLAAALQKQGKLEEAVIHFRRALSLAPSDAEIHSNLAAALFKHGLPDEAVDLYRRAIQINPRLPEVHYNLGNALRCQQQFEQAAASYRRALELNPELAVAHDGLGTALRSLGRLEEAAACHRRAIDLHRRTAKSNSASPIDYNNLGSSLQSAGCLDEAIEFFRFAIELDPGYTLAHCNLGVALQWQRRFDEAIACYERALAVNADDALAHFNRSFVRLLLGDWQAGWPEYEWRWKTGRMMERGLSQPRWQGEPLGRRTILLYGEQGFGDTFQFIRYARLVKEHHPDATVFFECHPPLNRILATYSGIDGLFIGGSELPRFDTHCPLLSLPGIFQTSPTTVPTGVPYLFADAALVERWRESLHGLSGMRVGINWQGHPALSEWRRRDVPLSMFQALARVEGVTLVSLQKDESKSESPLSKVEGPRPAIVDLGEIDMEHGAFMDTAAIMMHLDLVITADTSVAHLAGALGIPVWVVLPCMPDWRWLLDRSDSPWYPTMRLFRQKKFDDWQSVFEEIHAALMIEVQSGRS